MATLSAHGIDHRMRGRPLLQFERLELEAGSITALAGPNGAGKSTLLRLLAFLDPPSSGTILLHGRPVITARDRRLARRRVTLVEQRPLLFRGSAIENITYALSLHGVSRPASGRRALDALARLDIVDLADRQARALSDGETQRVAVARALALEPDVLLLDEPVSAADQASMAALYRAIEAEKVRGVAVCFASHQVEDAFRWSDRLLALTDGRLGPFRPVNLFRTVIPDGADLRPVRIGPLQLDLPAERSGPVTIVIPPDDIILSPAPLRSSARNAYPGTVTRIGDDGHGGITVTVDVGVDLHAHITRAALEDLRLAVGMPIVATFKTMAVRVF